MKLKHERERVGWSTQFESYNDWPLKIQKALKKIVELKISIFHPIFKKIRNCPYEEPANFDSRYGTLHHPCLFSEGHSKQLQTISILMVKKLEAWCSDQPFLQCKLTTIRIRKNYYYLRNANKVYLRFLESMINRLLKSLFDMAKREQILDMRTFDR
ncbi:MAG: hypothetical protein MHPSP_001321 [Paramarteilia canceri]